MIKMIKCRYLLQLCFILIVTIPILFSGDFSQAFFVSAGKGVIFDKSNNARDLNLRSQTVFQVGRRFVDTKLNSEADTWIQMRDLKFEFAFWNEEQAESFISVAHRQSNASIWMAFNLFEGPGERILPKTWYYLNPYAEVGAGLYYNKVNISVASESINLTSKPQEMIGAGSGLAIQFGNYAELGIEARLAYLRSYETNPISSLMINLLIPLGG
jgi:hypothetical protein